MATVLGILTAVAVVFGVIYVLWNPRWAFILVLFLFPLKQLLQSYFGFFQGTGGQIVNIVVAAIAGIALGMRTLKREPLISGLSNPATYLTWIIYALVVAGLLFSPAPEHAANLLSKGWPYYILLVGFMPLMIADLRDFRRMLVPLMAVGVALALAILLNPRAAFAGTRFTLDIGLASIDDATMRGNPLAVAQLGGILVLAGALVTFPRAGAMWMLLRAAVLVLGLGLAVASGSRGQALACVAVAMLFFPISRKIGSVRQFLATAIGAAVLLLAVYIVFVVFIGRQNVERWDLVLMFRDTNERLSLVRSLLELYVSNPQSWFQGLGTAAFVTLGFQDPYVHNVAVELLCEQGMIGGLLFLALSIFVALSGLKLWRLYRNDPPMRSAAAMLGALCTYSLLIALKQGNVATLPEPFFWWVVLAKVWTHERRAAGLAAGADEPHSEAWEESQHETYGDAADEPAELARARAV